MTIIRDVKRKKKQDFEYQGDLYKVKTFREITKLERNDLFVYESVPGTAVEHFKVTADSVEFQVEGPEDAQITLGMEDDTEYLTVVDGVRAAYSRRTAKLGPTGLKQWLLQALPAQTKAVENKLNQVRGDISIFCLLKDDRNFT